MPPAAPGYCSGSLVEGSGRFGRVAKCLARWSTYHEVAGQLRSRYNELGRRIAGELGMHTDQWRAGRAARGGVRSIDPGTSSGIDGIDRSSGLRRGLDLADRDGLN